MHFRPKGPSFKPDLNQPDFPPVKIHDYEIKEVTETKFLVVSLLTMTSQFSWINHMASLAKN